MSAIVAEPVNEDNTINSKTNNVTINHEFQTNMINNMSDINSTSLKLVYINESNVLNIPITVNITNQSSYDTTNHSFNEIVQNILDSSPSGSTFLFNGNNYTGLNLVINKPSNIISYYNTVINSSSNMPVFTLTENATNTNITGFTIISNGDGIFVNGANYTSIIKNIIFTNGNGIYGINSHNLIIKNNTIRNNTNGIYLNRIYNSSIEKNIIDFNKINGLYLNNAENINVLNNEFYLNNEGCNVGENVNFLNIMNNIFSKNGGEVKYGLVLNSASNMNIKNNTFIDNGNGLNVNASTKNLKISGNSFTGGHTGVNLDQGYRKVSGGLTLEYNAFQKGSGLCIEARNSIYEEVGGIVVGANWFGGNNVNIGFICPKVKAGFILASFSQSGTNTVKVTYLYNGKVASNLASFVATIFINGKGQQMSVNQGSGTFTVNGIGTANFNLGGDVTDYIINVTEWKNSNNPSNSSSNNNGNSSVINSGSGSKGGSTSSGTSGSSSSSGSSTGSVSLTGNSISNIETGSSSSSSSSSSLPTSSSSKSSSSSSASNSQITKTLTYDEDSFRVLGVPGLLLLIVVAICLYYNENILRFIKSNMKH